MVLDSVKTGLTSIWSNKLRSLLSILGIVFGVAALVSTMSIGEGTRRQILANIEALGSNLILVDARLPTARRLVATPGLTLRDAEFLRRHLHYAKAVAPLQMVPTVGVWLGGKSGHSLIFGTTPEHEVIFNHYVERGRFITHRDVIEQAKVCVVGADVAKHLEVEDLLGRLVNIKQGTFLVVGVMERKALLRGRATTADLNTYIPISVSRDLCPDPYRVSRIAIQGSTSEYAEQTKAEIERILTRFHGGHMDFSLWTQEELLKEKRRVSDYFRNALGSIAVVCLVIGGIGIMNILLASVTERIKEVGIRKALGATPLDILLQFLFESLLLTFTGGLFGIVVGVAMGRYVSELLRQYLPQRAYDWMAVTTPQTVLIAFFFAVLTGFIFGLYPAVKASRLDPCEALVYQ